MDKRIDMKILAQEILQWPLERDVQKLHKLQNQLRPEKEHFKVLNDSISFAGWWLIRWLLCKIRGIEKTLELFYMDTTVPTFFIVQDTACTHL